MARQGAGPVLILQKLILQVRFVELELIVAAVALFNSNSTSAVCRINFCRINFSL
jgi:hypothetical protein